MWETGKITGKVKYSIAFSETPAVMIALSKFEIGAGSGSKLAVLISNSDKQGFDYEITNSGGPQVMQAQAEWIAIGK